MKIVQKKGVVLTDKEVREAIMNFAFKKDPTLRNTSAPPIVTIVNKAHVLSADTPIHTVEAEVELERNEAEVVKP